MPGGPGAAAGAFPRGGSYLDRSGAIQNVMTGPLYSQPRPFGASIAQTAATFSLGRTTGCVMGGAQNGQGAGGTGRYGSIDSVTLCDAVYSQPPLFAASSVPDTLRGLSGA